LEMEGVFANDDSNGMIFEEVSHLVRSAVIGRNVCLFAMGQTGSGKTHTMSFPMDQRDPPTGDVDAGMIPRSINLIADWMSERKGWEYSVKGKYVEVYNNKVYDLLATKPGTECDVKMVKDRLNGKPANVYAALSIEENLTEAGDFKKNTWDMIEAATKRRRTKATAGNEHSSRSHSVLTLSFEGVKDVPGKPPKRTWGKLNLIDLAGSETADPNATKEERDESKEINISLTYLTTALGQMANKQEPSLRNTSITKLLDGSLMPGCKTLMFVMVSPLKKDHSQTIRTLDLAATALEAKMKSSPARAGASASPQAPVGRTPPGVPARKISQGHAAGLLGRR
jgi:kinesin family protein C1